MNTNTGRYNDIIDRERPVSQKHPHMSRLDRAAQFAPFAALTGYDDMIEEAGEMNAIAPDSVIFTRDDIEE